MTVSALLEQASNRSDSPIKLVISCYQLVPDLFQAWNKQYEHNLSTACEQTCLQVCYNMFLCTCVLSRMYQSDQTNCIIAR